MTENLLIPFLMKFFIFATSSFILAILITPLFTHFAYKNKWWKRQKDSTWISGGKEKALVFYKLHKEKHKRGIPTMAGIIIWGTIAFLTFLFNLDRAQTYLPLFTLLSFGFLGLVDDYFNIKSKGGIAGLSSKLKWVWLLILSSIGAWWFYYKLGWDIIHIPAVGNFSIGWLYIPLFILVLVATANAVNITDGLDGLSGGLLASSYGAYGILAFFQGKYILAYFCAAVVGAVLAYTWFNIYPARFFMGDTGSLALGATLGVIAMLTNSVFVLPIIGFIFVIEAGSSLLQLFSKKVFKRKIFISAPIHHHFEARGWPETKITMRFWIIGMVTAITGLIIGLLGRG